MPLITITATNARFVSKFPQGPDELWMADLKVCRHDALSKDFERVLFVESMGMAYIYGIEFEDGYPMGLNAGWALEQQSFIRFLREETRRDNDALGVAAPLFTGYQYSTEGHATAAYVAARGVPLVVGVGYRDNNGKYELLGVDPEDHGWL